MLYGSSSIGPGSGGWPGIGPSGSNPYVLQQQVAPLIGPSARVEWGNTRTAGDYTGHLYQGQLPSGAPQGSYYTFGSKPGLYTYNPNDHGGMGAYQLSPYRIA